MNREVPSLAQVCGAAEDTGGDGMMPASASSAEGAGEDETMPVAGGSAEGAGEGETIPAAAGSAEDADRGLNIPAAADPQQASPPRLSLLKPGPRGGLRLKATGTGALGLRPEAECPRPPVAVVRPIRWRPSLRTTQRRPPHSPSGAAPLPPLQSSPHATQYLCELYRINVRLTQRLQSYRRFMSVKENLLSLIRHLDARTAHTRQGHQ